MFMEFESNHLALKFCRVQIFVLNLLSSCSQDGEPAVVGCKFRAEGHGLVKVGKLHLLSYNIIYKHDNMYISIRMQTCIVDSRCMLHDVYIYINVLYVSLAI